MLITPEFIIKKYIITKAYELLARSDYSDWTMKTPSGFDIDFSSFVTKEGNKFPNDSEIMEFYDTRKKFFDMFPVPWISHGKDTGIRFRGKYFPAVWRVIEFEGFKVAYPFYYSGYMVDTDKINENWMHEAKFVELKSEVVTKLEFTDIQKGDFYKNCLEHGYDGWCVDNDVFQNT